MRIDSYSKIILSNEKEYIVSIQFGTLIGNTLVNEEFLNTFVLVPHIDVEPKQEQSVIIGTFISILR
ncbi:hypothetical protein COD14_31345 [Bacillus cereus]|nr:hypothetical protein COD14_31345 [Bacillus cereus]